MGLVFGRCGGNTLLVQNACISLKYLVPWYSLLHTRSLARMTSASWKTLRICSSHAVKIARKLFVQNCFIFVCLLIVAFIKVWPYVNVNLNIVLKLPSSCMFQNRGDFWRWGSFVFPTWIENKLHSLPKYTYFSSWLVSTYARCCLIDDCLQNVPVS